MVFLLNLQFISHAEKLLNLLVMLSQYQLNHHLINGNPYKILQMLFILKLAILFFL